MKLVVLGCGTSTGVPRIGNDWGDCDPAEPRNRRTRVAIAVEGTDGSRLLVDTPTDLRQQLLATDIARIDGVVWTHDHADHTHGIDDLRAVRMGRSAPIPAYAADETVRRLRQRFGYVFAGQFGYPTICSLENLDRVRMICGIGVSHCRCLWLKKRPCVYSMPWGWPRWHAMRPQYWRCVISHRQSMPQALVRGCGE